MIHDKNPLTPALPPSLVSIHGGHSGDYCQHARDSLNDIIKAYHDQNFAWVGISEHMPPIRDKFLYPDERKSGLSAIDIQARFTQYMAHCRNLQSAYHGMLPIFVGMETEAYQGALEYAIQLRDRFQPDFIVGSVHHVADIPIDMNPSEYAKAVSACGSIMDLYNTYFDLQYNMIHTLKPTVVGHFDLIRIFDPDYTARLKTPAIWKRICRNLEAIASLGLILDLNVRSLLKGGREPYPSRPILEKVSKMGIHVCPGDDSHSVDTVGRHVADGIRYLQALGISTAWNPPVITIYQIQQIRV